MSKVGVIVGRFQTSKLHEGHSLLIDTATIECDRVVIFLGCTHGYRSKRNPLDFHSRELLIFDENNIFLDNAPISVAPIFDVESNEEWNNNLDKKISEFVTDFDTVVLYGGRDSFLDSYKGKYQANVVRIESVDESLSATEDRKVCADVALGTEDFRHGVIYNRSNTYDRPDATVDIVPLIKGENGDIHYLLGRKPNEEEWRFIGGYVSPQDKDLESAAKRECYEESGTFPQELFYIGSAQVPDWRYRNSNDCIMTTFFGGWVTDFSVKAGDDISEVKWFKYGASFKEQPSIKDIHMDLVNKFYNWLDKKYKNKE